MTRSVLVLLLLCPTLARAELGPSAATARIRDRLHAEWQSLIAADKAVDWRIEFRGKTFRGDWVLHVAGWRYFFDRGAVRCRIQSDRYMTCNGRNWIAPRWTARAHGKRVTVPILRALHRGIWGDTLAITIDRRGHGHAIVETTVSTPDAETRTSRRYRAHVTLTAETFAIGEPQLVEEYRETCVGVRGCHATHWTCRRLTGDTPRTR